MRFLIVTILLFAVGCGGMQSTEMAFDNEMTVDSSDSIGWESTASKNAPAYSEQEKAATNPDPNITIANRKIIYTASMEVVVELFDGIEQRINTLVEAHGGFVSSANIGRMQGERRNGRWTVRVPVDQFDSFLNAVGNVGVPASRSQSASDVTEEYVDLEARIANKHKLESRIIELLERPDDKLQHVIEVEKELARVREDIERMEGRLRYLKDQTSLTTVTIDVREERDYVPPQTPTFSNRISSAWTTSLINCRVFFENLAVGIAGNAIGFAIFFVGLLIAIPILRWVYRLLKRWSGGMNTPETSSQS